MVSVMMWAGGACRRHCRAGSRETDRQTCLQSMSTTREDYTSQFTDCCVNAAAAAAAAAARRGEARPGRPRSRRRRLVVPCRRPVCPARLTTRPRLASLLLLLLLRLHSSRRSTLVVVVIRSVRPSVCLSLCCVHSSRCRAKTSGRRRGDC